MEQWHASPVDEVTKKLKTTEKGLGREEANSRLIEYGPNELEQKKGKSVLQLFIGQMKDVMIIVLIAAAIISAVLMKEVVEPAVIMAIVILNAVIGVVQEKKAEASLEALKKMSAPSAKVVRGGEIMSVPARDLVAGDLVVLEAGDMVPADMRLSESYNLKIQEAALTGESVPVDKNAAAAMGEDAALGDRLNMAFSSSVVTYGRGSGYVVETGMNTQVGRIAAMLQQEDDKMTPLQQKLDRLGKVMAAAALIICAVIFGVGLLNGKPVMDMFMTAVSLAVAAIPEGLPAISTIVLALSVQRMAKRHAIVRTLPSVETLGSATVICSDKTGTLTQNKMEVTHLYYDDTLSEKGASQPGDRRDMLMQSCVLCCDARYSTVEGAVTAIGDPTEIALIDIAKEFGMEKADMDAKFHRVDELPFDSERKLMTTVNDVEGKLRVFVKGAVDVLIARCDNIIDAGGVSPLDKEKLDSIAKANDEMAGQALRVLAMAYKDIEALPEHKDTLESGLTFIGLTGMIDPPRPEARDAVTVCRKAGIRPVMITGDHKTTAVAIAESLGILRENDLAITGADLEEMSDEQLASQVTEISVYARISPEHKVRIINAWRANGQIVAMTGDGVNDAPALKSADIGAAMGIVGTEVAKEAADLILTDDNFATVVSAVEEGRRIYDNILKTIQFLLSCNVGEIITLFVATMLGWEEPLLPVHILWVNLVTDSLPALGLGVDPAEANIMARQASVSGSVFSRDMVLRIIYQGVMIGCITLGGFVLGMRYSVEVGQTMAFCVLAFSQLVHTYNVRSHHRSIFSGAVGSNKYLLGAVAISALLMFLVLLIPPMEQIFSLVDLNLTQWSIVAGLCLVPIVVVETVKAIGRSISK